MAAGLHFIVVLCLTSGLWIGENVNGAEKGGRDCVTCPSGWTMFRDRCYLFQDAEKDWVEAERYCTSRDGNLASLPNGAVYDFIRKMIYRATNSHKTTWVGGYDAVKEGVWLWSDGSKFDFKGWAKGEPNNSGEEHCMEINSDGKDYVNDFKCAAQRSFVCARNP
ncbi:galactose-specific lectin nattectin-like [Xiphias gladius]|uniref:galactose-specific lectin nattectin-like n=1 Tax=Xiphias gladius TaxID=8245 RepID=UPI001A993CFF|nr:galactose-specific lectin nattectin-like [Xiphias gladius]XP_040007541.1 galactose-specific lectin nattectin-like [Xiphias gladius]